jgi:hypothetical protein
MVYEAKKKILQGSLTVTLPPPRKPMTNYMLSLPRRRTSSAVTIPSCSSPDSSLSLKFTSSKVPPLAHPGRVKKAE